MTSPDLNPLTKEVTALASSQTEEKKGPLVITFEGRDYEIVADVDSSGFEKLKEISALFPYEYPTENIQKSEHRFTPLNLAELKTLLSTPPTPSNQEKLSKAQDLLKEMTHTQNVAQLAPFSQKKISYFTEGMIVNLLEDLKNEKPKKMQRTNFVN